jgi:DNA-binding LytR/AlgR family response regulator
MAKYKIKKPIPLSKFKKGAFISFNKYRKLEMQFSKNGSKYPFLVYLVNYFFADGGGVTAVMMDGTTRYMPCSLYDIARYLPGNHFDQCSMSIIFNAHYYVSCIVCKVLWLLIGNGVKVKVSEDEKIRVRDFVKRVKKGKGHVVARIR